eukprot:TRINITY_DN6797_c0_g1_i1.p2 TRINITY_DN6797_c0_g1~~TRINITY_DN6797_c0_g1_i1.p2  ORF type:complete len:159 (-),score=29.99 TRINITY_DN6797_c0_g1_i1:9-485(-)
MQVVADNHAAASSRNCHELGIEQLLGPLEKLGQGFLAAEDEARLIKSCGQHAHPVLLQEPGMLEAAAARAVQDDNLGPQVAQGVESGHDGAWPGMNYPVSYTHLTLPTICSVQISVVAVSLKKKKKKNQVNHSIEYKNNNKNTQKKHKKQKGYKKTEQ